MRDVDPVPVAVASAPRWLLIALLLPIWLLILGGALVLGRTRSEAEVALLRAHDAGRVMLGVRRLDDRLHSPMRQLRALAAEPAVLRAVASGAPADLVAMQAVFERLISYTETYAKLRWIDAAGHERVRVNSVAGRAVAVPRTALQNVSASYFFKEGMRIKTGAVYVSPLDLNVEHGRVEVPYRPMLRLAMPMHGVEGMKRGLLVMDVEAQRLLDAFAESLRADRRRAMLLNSEGYWLLHPESLLEWGFRFGQRDTLGAGNPAVWSVITARPGGQALLADGVWTWGTAYPLKLEDSRDTTGLPYWYVVLHVPAEALDALRRQAWGRVAVYAGVLALLYGLWALWLARYLAACGRTSAR